MAAIFTIKAKHKTRHYFAHDKDAQSLVARAEKYKASYPDADVQVTDRKGQSLYGNRHQELTKAQQDQLAAELKAWLDEHEAQD